MAGVSAAPYGTRHGFAAHSTMEWKSEEADQIINCQLKALDLVGGCLRVALSGQPARRGTRRCHASRLAYFTQNSPAARRTDWLENAADDDQRCVRMMSITASSAEFSKGGRMQSHASSGRHTHHLTLLHNSIDRQMCDWTVSEPRS